MASQSFTPERVAELKRAIEVAEEALASMKKGVGCYNELADGSKVPNLLSIASSQQEAFTALEKSYEEFRQSLQDLVTEYENSLEAMGF